MKKRKLKPFVKNIIFILIGAFIGIVIYQLFTISEITKTDAGEYYCNGGIIKICSSNKKVAEYLGL